MAKSLNEIDDESVSPVRGSATNCVTPAHALCMSSSETQRRKL